MKVRFDFTTVKHQSASLLAKLYPDSPKVHEWRTKSFQIDRKHPAPGFFLQNPGNLLYYQSRGLVYMKESKTIQAVPGSGVLCAVGAAGVRITETGGAGGASPVCFNDRMYQN
jgi:hypothetical protein